MLFGAMNNPQVCLAREIERIAAAGFDFLDLTLEPPRAYVQDIDLAEVREQLQDCHLKVVVHSAYYLPFASPIASLRKCAVTEMQQIIEAAQFLAAGCCNLHFSGASTFFPYPKIVAYYLEALAILLDFAASRGVKLVIENVPAHGQLPQLRQLFEQLPQLGLHLDIAHAFIEGGSKQIQQYLQSFASRLTHVHISENNGEKDEHLPLGYYQQPPLDWAQVFSWLREAGYQDTVTLEIFQGGKEALLISLDKGRQLTQANHG